MGNVRFGCSELSRFTPSQVVHSLPLNQRCLFPTINPTWSRKTFKMLWKDGNRSSCPKKIFPRQPPWPRITWLWYRHHQVLRHSASLRSASPSLWWSIIAYYPCDNRSLACRGQCCVSHLQRRWGQPWGEHLLADWLDHRATSGQCS